MILKADLKQSGLLQISVYVLFGSEISGRRLAEQFRAKHPRGLTKGFRILMEYRAENNDRIGL